MFFFSFRTLIIFLLWVPGSFCKSLFLHSWFLMCTRIWSSLSCLGGGGLGLAASLLFTGSTINTNPRNQQSPSPFVSCDAPVFVSLPEKGPVMALCIFSSISVTPSSWKECSTIPASTAQLESKPGPHCSEEEPLINFQKTNQTAYLCILL